MISDKKSSEILSRYIRNMEEIKLRPNAINGILSKKYTTPYPATNLEFCCLQLRKILEIIILSSLITNKEIYEITYNDLKSIWNIKDVVEKVKTLNPQYYPIPVEHKNLSQNIINEMVPSGADKRMIRDELAPINNGSLTEKELLDYYYKTSSYIHSRNPFAKEVDYSKLEQFIIVAINKIIMLLNCHIAHLYDSDYFIYICMQNVEDGNVGGNIFEKHLNLNENYF